MRCGQQAVKFNLEVLISQPGILGRKIPVASLWDWESPPFTVVTIVTTSMPKYHQSDATICLHTDISFTWSYIQYTVLLGNRTSYMIL